MFRRRGQGPPPRPPVLDPSTGDPLAAPHTYLSDFQDDVEAAIYTDYRELIASGQVDAINDFTTLALHHEVGALALDAGLHLLTQKPLAISVRAGRRLVELARARGLTLGVFENVRQSPAVRAAAWAVRSGLIGDVHPDAARVAGWVAPMPGGVGPMTRAMLLANVVEAAERNAA